MAGWMAESGFRSGCPVATTLLETAPDSPALTQAGEQVFEDWIAIVQEVYESADETEEVSRRMASALVAAMEGALILARVRQSPEPILELAATFGTARAPRPRTPRSRRAPVSPKRR